MKMNDFCTFATLHVPFSSAEMYFCLASWENCITLLGTNSVKMKHLFWQNVFTTVSSALLAAHTLRIRPVELVFVNDLISLLKTDK